ncbi:MAG: hypothetical protein NTU49_02580 [Gammaproteobacteria bacterium]|nr:hypothetical protein [Gammaproteobacteria bacterium]
MKIEIPTPSEIADSIARCAPLYGMNYNDIIRILELLDGQEARDLVIGSVINHTKAYDGRGGQNYSDWLEGISPFSNHLSENAKTMAQNHFNNLVQQYGDKQWHFFSANAFLSILIDVKQLGLTIPDPIINAISKNIEVVIKKPLSKTLSQEIKEWLYVLQACPFEQFPALQPLEDALLSRCKIDAPLETETKGKGFTMGQLKQKGSLLSNAAFFQTAKETSAQTSEPSKKPAV